ncbi:MAG: dinitrogenase [Epsilonproteobacteria bacterium]|nr:dinitrogenase [Campylobacterota bacterium]NPA57039.1 dinitrogenase [Campylobacterota bacterium]
MLVAIPVKTAREETAVSPLFGHARYFAFIDDGGKMEIEENPYDGGMEVVYWLLGRGVNRVITHHIGPRPFEVLRENGLICYSAGEGRVLAREAFEALMRGELEEITPENIDRFGRHQRRKG